MKPLNKLRIAVCNDHAGFELKSTVLDQLKALGVVTVKDFGSYTPESCDYPDFAHPLATAVEKGEFDFGITICGSGNGIRWWPISTRESVRHSAGKMRLLP